MSMAADSFAFTGDVRCARRGAQCRLQGIERDTQQGLSLVLAGVACDSALPDLMSGLTLQRIGAGGPARWQLRWGGDSVELTARALHVQHAGSAALAAALPGVAPSWRGRVGWALLLNLVRVPGMTRLLQALRGGR